MSSYVQQISTSPRKADLCDQQNQTMGTATQIGTVQQERSMDTEKMRELYDDTYLSVQKKKKKKKGRVRERMWWYEGKKEFPDVC